MISINLDSSHFHAGALQKTDDAIKMSTKQKTAFFNTEYLMSFSPNRFRVKAQVSFEKRITG